MGQVLTVCQGPKLDEDDYSVHCRKSCSLCLPESQSQNTDNYADVIEGNADLGEVHPTVKNQARPLLEVIADGECDMETSAGQSSVDPFSSVSTSVSDVQAQLSSASLTSKVSTSSSASDKPRTLSSLGIGADSKTQTLGLEKTVIKDQNLTGRHAAYLDRKKKRQDSKRKQEAFLSNVPEVDDDIQFRYNYHIVGPLSNEAVTAACDHANQVRVKSGNADLGDRRSLIPIPYPPVAAQEASKVIDVVFERVTSIHGVKSKYAKLAFNPMQFSDRVPMCKNRFEALETAIIFALHVDSEAEGESYKEQLWAYEKAMFEFQTARAPLRPTRAILLLHTGPFEENEAKWRSAVEELEEIDGPVLYYGPMEPSDGAGIHHVMASLASMRIQRLQQSGGADSHGSHESEAPPLWEAEGF